MGKVAANDCPAQSHLIDERAAVLQIVQDLRLLFFGKKIFNCEYTGINPAASTMKHWPDPDCKHELVSFRTARPHNPQLVAKLSR